MKRISYNDIAPSLYSISSILFALVTGGIILLFIGKSPLDYFGQLFSQGMGTELGVVESIIKMAPLLIMSAGLMACFSAGLWNIGGAGQFLIGAMLVGWAGPTLYEVLPFPLYLLVAGGLGALGGMIWIFFPAVLKARYDINEIITTMMMTWVALNLVTWLVKRPDQRPHGGAGPDRASGHGGPHAHDTLDQDPHRLVVGLVSIIGMHWVIRRTTLGYQFRVLLATNRRRCTPA